MLTRVKCRRAERDRLLPHLLPCSLRQQLRPHSPGTRPPAGTRPATTPRSGDEPSKCLNGSREKEQTSNVSTWTPTSTDRTPPPSHPRQPQHVRRTTASWTHATDAARVKARLSLRPLRWGRRATGQGPLCASGMHRRLRVCASLMTSSTKNSF